MTNFLLQKLICVHFFLQLIESSGEVFSFHPSASGYQLHGMFEIPDNNFAGNQFWLCFDYEASAKETPKRSFGRYLRSVIQAEEVEDETTTEISEPTEYPENLCGGQMDQQSSYWFALNGVWIDKTKLQVQVLNVRSLNKKTPSVNMLWKIEDPNEETAKKVQLKLVVQFQGSSPSIVTSKPIPSFMIPPMKANGQVQIRLNGLGVRLDALIANLYTPYFPLLLPSNLQVFDKLP
ncbi:hypothetical protein M3Y97_00510400 [Aphelenchoides bicaudatus]|nr:hypothetical protein M3Y97_00510400 [Aphelenchoides bicaudatus]